MGQKETLFRSQTDTKKSTGKTPLPLVIIVFVAAVLLGGASGFFAQSFTGGTATQSTGSSAGGETATADDGTPQSAGIRNETFTDNAEGVLREGGLEGEGSHHLERPGGESQNVYLTSSTVDLAPFVGKKVLVEGKTYSVQTAGWFMDVGYIELK